MESLHAKAAAEGESVLDYFRITRTALMSSLAACSEAGDARGVALVSNSLVGVLERLGKLTGEIAALAGGTINVTNVTNIINSPIFARLQAAQLKALAPFPEARAATVAAWRELDAETVDAGRAPLVIDARPMVPPCPVPLPEPTA